MSHTADDKLREGIHKALNITSKKADLEPFYEKISFETLKQALRDIINTNKVALRPLYHQVINIDHIFPTDIIQEIISYQGLHLHNLKCVNKQWKDLCEKNETKSYSELDKHENKHGLSYNDKINTTWIIPNNRNQLTKVEKARNYKMARVVRTSRDPHTWFKEYTIDFTGSISGDRHYIYPGHYKVKKHLILKGKNFSLIGIPSSKEHEHDGSNSSVRLYWDVEYDESGLSAIHIDNEGHLRIIRCKIRSMYCGIHVGRNSCLDVNKSSLECGSYNSAVRIEETANKVSIQQTVFKSSKYGVQLLTMGPDKNKGKKLICKHNVFMNIKSYAIIHRPGITLRAEWNNVDDDYVMRNQCESYEIKHNKLKTSRYHKTSKIAQLQNPNRIYVRNE